MFAELALKTPDYKRMPGFVRIYLGRGWEIFERLATVIGFTGSLVGFMVVGGQFFIISQGRCWADPSGFIVICICSRVRR